MLLSVLQPIMASAHRIRPAALNKSDHIPDLVIGRVPANAGMSLGYAATYGGLVPFFVKANKTSLE